MMESIFSSGFIHIWSSCGSLWQQDGVCGSQKAAACLKNVFLTLVDHIHAQNVPLFQ